MIDYSKENSDVIELRLYYSFKLLLLYFLKLESMIETDLHAGIVEAGERPFLFFARHTLLFIDYHHPILIHIFAGIGTDVEDVIRSS